MFRFFKRRAARKAGEKTAKTMTAVLDMALDSRFSGLTADYLKILKERMEDSDGYPPATVIAIEFNIFCEQCDKLASDLPVELRVGLMRMFDDAREIGVQDVLNKYAETQIKARIDALKLMGETLVRMRLEEMKKGEVNGGHNGLTDDP